MISYYIDTLSIRVTIQGEHKREQISLKVVGVKWSRFFVCHGVCEVKVRQFFFSEADPGHRGQLFFDPTALYCILVE